LEACILGPTGTRPRGEGAITEFIESVLLYTAEQHHGGALLFVPEDTADDDPRLLEAASIKYKLPSTRPRDALRTAMAVRLEHNATADRLRERSRIRPEELEELEALEWNQRNYEDSARDAARFIASLTAVDGAVVLTDKLRIIGFGAEVRAIRVTEFAPMLLMNEEFGH
jgi:hypothetical protein